MTLTHDSPSRAPRRLGPLDDGLRLGMAEYEEAEYEPGYQYELVAGRLRVNAAPNPAHESVAMRLAQLFSAWKLFGPDPGVFDWICTRSRVIDESDPEAPSSVEPDERAALVERADQLF